MVKYALLTEPDAGVSLLAGVSVELLLFSPPLVFAFVLSFDGAELVFVSDSDVALLLLLLSFD